MDRTPSSGMALVVMASGLLLGAAALRAEKAQAEEPVLTNPVPYTTASIARGRKHYLRYCQTCHGFDGRALENVDFEAADLTRPSAWHFGSTDADIFRTTRDGAGDDMPPFRKQLRDPQIWELVNYIRSLGPEEHRPLLVEEAEVEESSPEK